MFEETNIFEKERERERERGRKSVPLISMDDFKPREKEKCVDTRVRSFLFSLDCRVCFLSLQTDRTLSRIPEKKKKKRKMKRRRTRKKRVLEKPLTEFYDPSFGILPKIVRTFLSSLLSV